MVGGGGSVGGKSSGKGEGGRADGEAVGFGVFVGGGRVAVGSGVAVISGDGVAPIADAEPVFWPQAARPSDRSIIRVRIHSRFTVSSVPETVGFAWPG